MRHQEWELRLVTALQRAHRFGADDWTNDVPQLIEEFYDEHGTWGSCDTCPSEAPQTWVKVTEVGGSNPDVLKMCSDCREPHFPARKQAA